MVDELKFQAPLGFISHLFLVPYMRRFLQRRALELKRIAETSSGLP
jgi:hypothetical protein